MALYIKAFSLVVKTASKPLAKRLKIAISDSPSLRAWAIDAARAASRLSAFILRDESAEAAAERAQLCAVIDAQHSTMSDMAALIEELMRYREESRAHIAALQTARR